MKSILLATVVLTITPLIAFAGAGHHKGQGDHPHHSHHFNLKHIDTNTDRVVDFNEFLQFSQKTSTFMFERFDANSDGIVTKAEFDARVVNDARKRFEKHDRNGDGVLNKEDRKLARAEHENKAHPGQEATRNEHGQVRILPYPPVDAQPNETITDPSAAEADEAE